MQDINSMLDYSLRPSHAPISKRGGKKPPTDLIPAGTVAGDYLEFPNVAGAPSMHKQMAKRGGAGIMSAEMILAGLQNQISLYLKKHVSESIAPELARGIVGLVKDSFKLLFPKTGGLTKKEVLDKGVKVGKKVGKVALPIALDVGVNTGAQYLSNAVLDPIGLAPVAPLVGKIVGKVARSQIKKKVGYGCDGKAKGVGVYGGKKPKKTGKTATSGSDKRKQRGAIVRKLMKDEGMSFVQASKEASKHMK